MTRQVTGKAMMNDKRKTLGDLSVPELLKSARSELDGLHECLKRSGIATRQDEKGIGDGLVIGAYLGSIGARISVAELNIDWAVPSRPLLARSGNVTDVSNVTSFVFGILVRLATPHLKAYHNDLYHDAIWLHEHCKGERYTFDWSVNESGTTMAEAAELHPCDHRKHLYRLNVYVVNKAAYVTIDGG